MIFDINYPTKVMVGVDATAKTGEKLKELGVTKALIVTDQNMKKFGVADRIIENIQAAGIAVVEYDKVLPDPPDTQVNEAGELGRKEGVDGIVGIGGGSVLDSAKAINVLLTNPGNIQDYFGFGIPSKPGKPTVLIPTTAGTGADISVVSAISDSRNGEKAPLFSPAIVPTLSIVDPLLTVSVPPSLTATTGVDTLMHAIEAYTSGTGNPMADIISLEAIALAGKNLKTAVLDGKDVDARYGMSFACTLAGMAITQAFTHLPHAVGTPIGTRYHIPHGNSVAPLLPMCITYCAEIMPEKTRKIGQALGLELAKELSAKEVGNIIAAYLRNLLKEIKIPSLKELNIQEADLPAIAQDSFGNPCINFVPQAVTVEQILELLKTEYNA
ncbi:iron-containing alcohol dehydrogenase [Dehalobacter sp. DCM]|uniref:iron-containing alcohol dehydrogenase n=1 Tax=Dehalobacter sp. DCM TaxID=2907827 RepID=UPI003081989A|nr:iron-containing alcohol dehydrogenase [Dehalobacter sp. DCM]